MKDFKLDITVDGVALYGERWFGYCEEVAISQAMLYHSQRGARSVSVDYIEEVIKEDAR